MCDFKSMFKYYKSRNPPPSLDRIVTCRGNQEKIQRISLNLSSINKNEECRLGLKSVQQWDVFELPQSPGFIILKNIFSNMGQRYWICRSLHDFTKKPNHMSIDVLNLLNDQEDWWHVSQSKNVNERKQFMEKLRWVTLGYHHNWDTKVYSETQKDLFPEDLGALCQYIGIVLGFNNFKAEAAIINLYHMKSTLAGHTDHSEQNLDAPLFSFSFGQSAVFLIGGKNLDDTPTPILLESGDVCIMSRQSRLNYHGVPLILKSDVNIWSDDESTLSDSVLNSKLVEKLNDKEFLKPFQNYIQCSRININVRQVLYDHHSIEQEPVMLR